VCGFLTRSSGISSLQPCERLVSNVNQGPSDLTVLFTIDEDHTSDGCKSNNNSGTPEANNSGTPVVVGALPAWAIALIVVGSVLAAAVIVVVVVMKTKKLREMVRPFENARTNRSSLTGQAAMLNKLPDANASI